MYFLEFKTVTYTPCRCQTKKGKQERFRETSHFHHSNHLVQSQKERKKKKRKKIAIGIIPKTHTPACITNHLAKTIKKKFKKKNPTIYNKRI